MTQQRFGDVEPEIPQPRDLRDQSGGKITREVRNLGAMHRVLVEQFIASFEEPPEELILDFDATDDPVHGRSLANHHTRGKDGGKWSLTDNVDYDPAKASGLVVSA